jgi:hypothetical protein
MQGIDATFDEFPIERGRDLRPVLLKFVPGAAALALAGSLGVWALHLRHAPAPAFAAAQSALAPKAAPATEASNPFGDIIVDPSFVAEMQPPEANLPQLSSLEAVPSGPAAVPEPESAPSASVVIPLPDVVPLPPKRDVPEIADTTPPLPPPRPAEFAAPVAPAGPAQQNASAARPAAPADSRNIFEKLLGLGQAAPPAVAGKAPEGRLAKATPEWRLPAIPPIFGGSGASPVSGYDRYTAVYDISARTVYLPDGTRLEAHSGYGNKLDDPRYVNERMVGPTPPNVYELTPREASFHGVQALRLTPVGDSPLFGRAGLLAHPYMLGPNGDSNGCVSVKDYEAFLRAYQNGQVKKLVVVAKL